MFGRRLFNVPASMLSKRVRAVGTSQPCRDRVHRSSPSAPQCAHLAITQSAILRAALVWQHVRPLVTQSVATSRTNTLKQIGELEHAGHWQQAVDLLRGMQADGIDPNAQVYSAVIAAVGRSGQWEQALGLFGEMKAAGVRPDAATFSALVSALENGGQQEHAQRVRRVVEQNAREQAWQVREQRKMEADQRAVSKRLQAAAEPRLLPAAEPGATAETGAELRPDGPVPDGGGGGGGGGAASEREPVCTPGDDVYGDGGCPFTKRIVEVLETGMTKGRRRQGCQKALAVHREMQAAGVWPCAETYTVLIALMGEGGRWQAAYGFLEDMKNGGIQGDMWPDARAYGALIRALKRAGERERADQVFDEMRAFGVAPARSTRRNIMRDWAATSAFTVEKTTRGEAGGGGAGGAQADGSRGEDPSHGDEEEAARGSVPGAQLLRRMLDPLLHCNGGGRRDDDDDRGAHALAHRDQDRAPPGAQ